MTLCNSSRKSYDTFLISLYKHEKEHLIPDQLRAQIPSSTISDFRNRSIDHYFGSELWELQNEMLDHHELMLKHAQLKKLLAVVTAVWLSFARVGAFAQLREKQLREWLVDKVQLLSTVMPKSTAIRLTGLSSSAFSYSLSQIEIKCNISPFQLCRKRHPLQLSTSEVNTIQQLMSDPQMICWPASSIFHYARREKMLVISQSTFYRYLKILGISKRKKWKVKAKNGIKAECPNQFLHVDTTFWRLPDGQRTATVFVSDNFSRHILGYCSALTHSFKNVEMALTQTVKTIRAHYPDQIKAHLIVDGGGENNALQIEEFVNTAQSPKLVKWIAQKDISFSNSPVEAINKIFKRYLRHIQPQDFQAFQKCVSDFVADYTRKRPHGSLNGYTPFEAYTQGKMVKIDYSKDIVNAQQQRLRANRKANCTDCQ